MLNNGLPYSVVTIALLWGFFVGACCGSAVLCFLMRKQSGESWVSGRSHCDKCGHVLGATDLIPILSYLLSGGKCRYCGEKIPKNLLYAELFFAIIGVLSMIPFLSMRNFFSSVLIAVSLFVVGYCVCKRIIVKDLKNKGGGS